MKAIIPAAGLGSRFLPATKAQPKEMLLVVDRPVIQYVVEEGLASKADEVVIVNSRSKKAIEDHFTPDPDLVSTLRARGKDAYADEVERVGNYNVSYVYQEEPLGLGHAIWCAHEKTAGEPFYVLLGDVIVPDNQMLPAMQKVSDEHGGARSQSCPCPMIRCIALGSSLARNFPMMCGKSIRSWRSRRSRTRRRTWPCSGATC